MSQQSEKTWTRYRRIRILSEDEVVTSTLAADDQSRQVIIHEMRFGADVNSAARMRLEYETTRLSQLTSDRQLAPVDFEFHESGCRVSCPLLAGETLQDRISSGRLTIDESMTILNNVLETLAFFTKTTLFGAVSDLRMSVCRDREPIFEDSSPGMDR